VPYSGRDGLTGRVGGTTPGYDSQAYQRGGVARIRLRLGRLHVLEHEMLWSGKQVGSGEPMRDSSEAKSFPRGSYISVVLYPSNETELRPRGLRLTVLVGRWGRHVHEPLPLGRDRLGCVLWLWGCLCFVICERKMEFPQVF
jgi:hypothetical protein